jgi:uncharacterized sulfatase
MALALVAAWGCGETGRPIRERPNIVMIVGDDVGWDHFGFMGSETIKTPHLDLLAEQGMVFTHGYTTASICRPSLRSMLTGLHPYQWNVRVRALAREGIHRPDIERIELFQTLPRLLAERGYASFQGGKFWEADHVIAGFTDGMQKPGDRMATHASQGRYLGRTIGLEPVETFVDAHRDEPFFLFLAPMLPHTPHDAVEYRYLYDKEGISHRSKWYYATVTKFDAFVGDVVRLLVERDLRRRTLVVYLADNGWDQGPDFTGGATPIDGPRGKKTAHELGFRTPIIFSWPGVVPGGVRSDVLVSAVDVFPTLLDAAGARVPDDRPGRSLWPTILENAPWKRERVIGWNKEARVEAGPAGRVPEKHGADRAFFLRDADWWYIWYKDRGVRELYDLRRDPHSLEDVSARHPERVAELQAAVETWAEEMAAPFEKADPTGYEVRHGPVREDAPADD